jgi:hypothetical protein
MQNSHATWLTPRRLKVATIGVMGTALAVSTIGLSGSTPSPHNAAPHGAASKAPAAVTRSR